MNHDIPTSVDAANTNPDSARIQAALNACAGTDQAVELSRDSTGALTAFLSGPLTMPSDVTLLVDPGVTLFFSRNAQDFDLVSGTHTCGTVNGNSANKSCKPPIYIPTTSANVGIMGYGPALKVESRSYRASAVTVIVGAGCFSAAVCAGISVATDCFLLPLNWGR